MIVRKLFTLLGFKTDKKGFRDADKSLQKIKQTALRVAAILVAGRVVKSIASIATETAKLSDEVSKVAEKLGVTTDALQEFRFAAQLTGVPIRTADLALQRFTRRTAEAAQGEGEAKAALKELGVQLVDSQGKLRPVGDLLADVAEGLKNTKTQGDRLRLSFNLFDSEGAALVNTLKGGRDAFNAMAEEARATGGIFDEELIKASIEFTDQQTKMKLVLQGVKNIIAKELLPFMIRMTNRIIGWVKANRELLKGKIVEFIQRIVNMGRRVMRFFRRLFDAFNELPKASKLILGVAASVAVLALILQSPVALLLLIIGLVALVIDDFETWEEGGDSLFSRMAFWLNNLTGLWARLRDVSKEWFDDLKFILETLNNIGFTFQQFFFKLLSGEIGEAFDTLGRNMRQVFADTFDFIDKRIKGDKLLELIFDTSGAQAKAGRRQLGPRFHSFLKFSRSAQGFLPGTVPAPFNPIQRLDQSTSNLFQITGDNSGRIANDVADKVNEVQRNNNRQAAQAFKRRAAGAD